MRVSLGSPKSCCLLLLVLPFMLLAGCGGGGNASSSPDSLPAMSASVSNVPTRAAQSCTGTPAGCPNGTSNIVASSQDLTSTEVVSAILPLDSRRTRDSRRRLRMVPLINGLMPAGHIEGFGDFVLTVNGNNFDLAAQVQWCSGAPVVCAPRPTTFVDRMQLTAAISAADVASAGSFAVMVQNPGPLTSAPASFTVRDTTVPTATLALFRVDGSQVLEAQKLTPGANLSINDDHDNGTSEPDNADSIINGDDDRRDMVTLALNVQGLDPDCIVHLSADHPNLIRVFDESGNPADLASPYTIDPSRFAQGAISYHAEGLAAGTVTLTLTATQGTAPTSTDRVGLVVGQQTTIHLTFDDGPDSANPEYGQNLTETVVETLASSIVGTNIPATFFVQTHVPFRGGDPIGQEMIQLASQEGSHVEVHTGNGDDKYCDPNQTDAGLCDHVAHTVRVGFPAYDVTGDNNADGQNALESDMMQAKARILTLTGRTPLRVRPPYLLTNAAVLAVYANTALTETRLDVDSGDTTACSGNAATVDCMKTQLTTGIQNLMGSGRDNIIVLFHDIIPLTANNLTEFLKAIQKAVRYKGRNEQFALLP